MQVDNVKYTTITLFNYFYFLNFHTILMIKHFPILAIVICLASCQPSSIQYDIIIYGGTSAGVIAAYSAKMEGKSVLLIEPKLHLGGLSSSGLGETDIGNKYAVTGLSRNFYRRLGDHYGVLESWKFEPHVAEGIFDKLIAESGVEVLKDYRLVDLKKRAKRIKSISIEKSSASGKDKKIRVKGLYFIDCSYEGDLMAKAGISYTVGRESNDTYGETYNGVQMMNSHQFPDNIDPYMIPGDSASGLCWGIQGFGIDKPGAGDKKVQAYNYRLCLTSDPENMIPITRPATYDSTRYELLRRVIKHYQDQNRLQNLGQQFLIISRMPNDKTDINNRGGFSTDGIGMNWDYPEAGFVRRAEIAEELKEYTRGLLYFLGNDPSVPQSLKDEMLSLGWPKDEFIDNEHFPYEMYVREARRMIGEYVMTEHNCVGDSTVSDGIGLAAYTMDSHNCQRVVIHKDGKAMVKNEGNVEIGGFPPYEIAYRALTPKREECENLIVPVCLSASHIAFGSIRMEPVFMVLAQVAAVAVAMADAEGIPVQEVNIEVLKEKLLNDPLQNGTPPDIIIDNSDLSKIELTGSWQVRSYFMGQNKADFLLSESGSGGVNKVKFNLPPVVKQEYRVYTYIPRPHRWQENSAPQWAKTFDIFINSGDSVYNVIADMSNTGRDWLPLGTYTFEGEGYIEISSGKQNLPIPGDAIMLVPLIKQSLSIK